MAEPFSIAAAALALLPLANKVITFCLDLHPSTVRKELDQIIDAVDSVRDVLQRLARLPQDETEPNSPSTPDARISGSKKAFSQCQTELEYLEAELVKLESPKLRFGTKTIAWILKEKDMELRLKRLSRAKETLQLSLTLDQT